MEIEPDDVFPAQEYLKGSLSRIGEKIAVSVQAYIYLDMSVVDTCSGKLPKACTVGKLTCATVPKTLSLPTKDVLI